MYKLAIDIGNTRIKAGYFNSNGDLELIKIYNKFEDFKIELPVISSIISNVRNDFKFDFNFKTHFLNYQSNLNFKNFYESPKTIGTDRLANLAGSVNTFSNEDKFIISFGTCITFDFINKNNEYMGGNISPGLKMRFKSMHEMSGKLPLSDSSHFTNEYGKNTNQAISNGVIKGIIYEIEGYINTLKLLNNQFKVIFTGGDSEYFANQLNFQIFALPNLTLMGLYNLLLLNEK